MTPEFQSLRQTYVDELRAARRIADAWWHGLVASEVGGSDVAAEAEARRRWPDGPASHPAVIAVIVRCVHACDAINQRVPRADQEQVGHFVMHSIDTDDTQDLIDFTDTLSYWPLGQDRAGRVV